jgi:hypothetical protein
MSDLITIAVQVLHSKSTVCPLNAKSALISRKDSVPVFSSRCRTICLAHTSSMIPFRSTPTTDMSETTSRPAKHSSTSWTGPGVFSATETLGSSSLTRITDRTQAVPARPIEIDIDDLPTRPRPALRVMSVIAQNQILDKHEASNHTLTA